MSLVAISSIKLCILLSLFVRSHSTFDYVDEFDSSTSRSNQEVGKDKILLKDVKTLTFLRNKRTTSRRTHSIHQLSCVGGTAGCKLFTPDSVECTNLGFDSQNKKFNWRCRAEISDRVKFNHVEVICEGYDYPEDDYILLGSCGLEFTLDYSDPLDHHENSYFRHMDEHEKEMHHERVRATAKPGNTKQTYGFLSVLDHAINYLNYHPLMISFLFIVLVCSFIVVRYVVVGKPAINRTSKRSGIPSRTTSYGPLASAVLTTKKAC